MFRLLIYLIGFGMLVIGSINSIAYLNMLTMGNDWPVYIKYIFTEPGCLILFVGLLFIYISTIQCSIIKK